MLIKEVERRSQCCGGDFTSVEDMNRHTQGRVLWRHTQEGCQTAADRDWHEVPSSREMPVATGNVQDVERRGTVPFSVSSDLDNTLSVAVWSRHHAALRNWFHGF